MSEKKVVVQVLADTKPFIKSLGKLRSIAESVNSAQIKSSNKVLKNVANTARINQKIHQIALKNAKIQERVSRDAERAQGRFLQGAVRTVAVLDMVRRSFNVIKGGFLSGYKTGRDIVDPARTYGVPLQQATRANALYSAFGGEAGGGAKIMSDFLQNQMEFMLYQRGTLKEASALFGLNPATLMHGELVDFVKEQNATVIFRGLRAVSDFEYELQMAQLNRNLSPEVDTLFLATSVAYAYLSSSSVREVAKYHGGISSMVPAELLEEIKEKF